MSGQAQFLAALERFIGEVQGLPRFKGQAQAVKALRRIPNLAVFRRG